MTTTAGGHIHTTSSADVYCQMCGRTCPWDWYIVDGITMCGKCWSRMYTKSYDYTGAFFADLDAEEYIRLLQELLQYHGIDIPARSVRWGRHTYGRRLWEASEECNT